MSLDLKMCDMCCKTRSFLAVRPDSAQDRQTERQARVNELFKTKGWLPTATLIGRDDPNHKQMRALFNEAFRPAKIHAMDGFVQQTAESLFEKIAGGSVSATGFKRCRSHCP